MGRRLRILLLVVASGCGVFSGPSGPGPGADPTAPTAPAGEGRAGSGTTSSSVIPARFEFVDYTVAGGTPTASDHLKVYPDGRAVYDDGSRVVNFTVTLQTVAELRTALEQADLDSLPAVAGEPPGADRRVFRVIFGGEAVRFDDATVPPGLRPALAILDREVARGKSLR